MYNIIGNSCIGSWITAKILKQQFVNPFCWSIMNFDSCVNLLQHFYDIDFANFNLDFNGVEFTLTIDKLVSVQYVHYKFDDSADTIRTSGEDVLYNRIWEYIVSKYLERTRRMIDNKITPVFIFAGAGCADNRRSSFTIDEQHKLDAMNIKFKTYVSFGEMIQYANPKIISLHQHGTYKGNTLHMATDLFKQMTTL